VKRILVIRHGALGDFVLSFGPFAAIRAHHPRSDITLLTTRPFAGLAAASPWFDHVAVDDRPSLWNVPGLMRLARRLRGFDFVYDLQTSRRTGRYLALAGKPGWSGHAQGASHRQGPARETMHTLERQRDQLRQVGIVDVPRPDLSFLIGEPIGSLPRPFALLVPGAAPHRPAKRWPAERYGGVAAMLAGRGVVPVVVGSSSEAGLAAAITAICPEAIDLTGQTSIAALFALAAQASLAIGNDTGPMHIAAAVGCRCLVLFSGNSNPAMTAPRYPDGGWPEILRVQHLSDLTVARVAAALP
jgi:ADP-heptose:LPS heptosyltransferase